VLFRSLDRAKVGSFVAGGFLSCLLQWHSLHFFVPKSLVAC